MSPVLFLAWLPVVIVIVSVLGLALLVLGVRGQPIFSSPRCAKCGYDLRNVQFMSNDAAAVGNCPECGNDLARIGAVTFGKWQRQPRRIVWGAVLLVLPWVLAIGLVVVVRSRARYTTTTTVTTVGPQAKAQMTTPALLGSLKTTANQPWDWQELERRMQNGQLTPADVDAALAILTADIAAARAKTGNRQPIHWADDFVKAAVAGGNASAQQVNALAQAFYSPDPAYKMRSRAREGEPFGVTLNLYEPWDLPGMRQVWSLADITADGTTKLVPQKRVPGGRRAQTPPAPMHPDELSGTPNTGSEVELVVPHALPRGEHEITITRDVGIVAANATMRGLDGKPGTPDKWPSPPAQWRSVVKRKLTIVPKDASVFDVVTDPNADPFKNGKLVVKQALVRPSTRGVEVVLEFDDNPKLAPVLSYKVWISAGGEKLDYGMLVIGTSARGGIHTQTSAKAFKQLSPDVTNVDLLFEVDEKAAEPYLGIEQIWGKPHVIQNVKLQRFDLSPNANGDPPATQPR